jgi:hypothetical protein
LRTRNGSNEVCITGEADTRNPCAGTAVSKPGSVSTCIWLYVSAVRIIRGTGFSHIRIASEGQKYNSRSQYKQSLSYLPLIPTLPQLQSAIRYAGSPCAHTAQVRHQEVHIGTGERDEPRFRMLLPLLYTKPFDMHVFLHRCITVVCFASFSFQEVWFLHIPHCDMTSICSLQHLSSWVLVDAGYLHPSCATITLGRYSGRTGIYRQALAVVRRREGSGRVLYDWDGDAIFGVALGGRGYVAERGCAEMWLGRVRQFLGIRERVSACEEVVNNRGEAMIIARCGWFYRTLQQITASTLASVPSSNTRARQYLPRWKSSRH